MVHVCGGIMLYRELWLLLGMESCQGVTPGAPLSNELLLGA